jgi:hypothetical protein
LAFGYFNHNFTVAIDSYITTMKSTRKLAILVTISYLLGSSLCKADNLSYYRHYLLATRPDNWSGIMWPLANLIIHDIPHTQRYVEIAVDPRRIGTHIYREKVRRIRSHAIDVLNSKGDVMLPDSERLLLCAAVSKVARDAIAASHDWDTERAEQGAAANP